MTDQASAPASSSPHAKTAPPACRNDDPGLFLVSALRLFACPCAAPIHETLREDSPAARLVEVMRAIDAHARRPLRLYPADCREKSSDEAAFLALIGCAQQDRRGEMTMRCRTMVRAAGQAALARAVTRLARCLSADGIVLDAPAPVPAPAGPPVLGLVTAAG